MKKIVILFLLTFGLLYFFSCEDDEVNGPTIDLSEAVPSTIINPADGNNIVLLRDSADAVLASFEWTAAEYNMDNTANIKYSVMLNYMDSSVLSTATVAQTFDLSKDITHGEMNQKLMGLGMVADVEDTLQISVTSSISEATTDDDLTSDPITVYITPYSDIVDVKPIYLLGGATSVGWANPADTTDPSAAIAAVYLPESGADSTFAVVDSLRPEGVEGSDGFIKFVRYRGIWAPQWGSDGEGTWESGNLVYRATDADPDPSPIPAPDVQDDYLIKVDIVNLTYEITETVQSLHIIGDATDAGWDNTLAIPMTKVAPGKYSLITTLSADATEGFKFLENQGAWAPMYGQDGSGTFENGKLQYRPTEADPDPSSIPPPAESGTYLIEVDIAAGTYQVMPQ